MRLPDSSLASPFADYQPHSLFHLTGYASLDLEHGGAFLGPRVSWNALKDMDFELGGLFSTGELVFLIEKIPRSLLPG